MNVLKKLLIPTKKLLRSKAYYDELARHVLAYSIVGLDGKPRKITAIEFYFYHSEVFPDEASHCHEVQLDAGEFYIHFEPKFHSPNYSGIDITCGNRKENIYGGILIRALDHRDGSGLAIRALIRGDRGLEKVPQQKGHPLLRWSENEKQSLRKIHGTSIFTGPVHLKKTMKPEDLKLLTRKRIGIDGKNFEDRLYHYYLSKE